jgi:chemotaxis protein MotB
MMEETEEGLNIEIVDQDGRAMFPDGSKTPYERTRKLIEKFGSQFKTMPYRLSISGHSAASRQPARPGYGPWDLSADRANAIRRILEESGVPASHFYMVAGRADTQPLFPDDPYIAANRRVTITLMREAPAVPANLKP